MKITVFLLPEESEALSDLAQRERRHPREQAAILLRRELELRGLLEPERGAQGSRTEEVGQ